MRLTIAFLAAVPLLSCGPAPAPDRNGAAPAPPAPRIEPKAAEDPTGGDWPQWGRTASKNMSSPARGLPFEIEPGQVKPDGTVDLATTKNVLWVAKMGSQTYGNPTVARGRVFVGTNNEGRGDPRFKGDYSVLHCLDAATGQILWSLTVPKLGTGKVGDWEFLGICSSPTVVDDRVYLVTNRCEVMCLDVNGLADGNQGLQDEAQYMAYVGTTPGKPVELKPTDADILWRYNMIEELGVFPHNITSSSILVVGDILYCSTSNGVTYDHTDIPSPKAPALIALNRRVAERPGATPREILVGEEGSGLSRRILHGNWTSPSWGEVNGKGILIYGGPDGFCYAFDPNPVKDADGFGVFPELWRYDCNPPDLRYRNGDPSKPIKYATLRDGPSEIIATPVFHEGRIYVAIGQDPEHRGGPGNLSCLDAATGKKVWDLRIDRTMSTCSVADGRVYAADWSGFLYCVDAATGTLQWKYDTGSEIWCSPLVADDKIYLGNYDGVLTVFAADLMRKAVAELGPGLEVQMKRNKLLFERGGKTLKEVAGDDVARYVREARFAASISCTPVVAQGVLYVATMRHLYAIKEMSR
jgi:outer membrane protein assembly factor BamB